MKIGVKVAGIALHAKHSPRQQQARLLAPIATPMHSQQAVQAPVVALLGTGSSQVMVNEVPSAEAVDVEKALQCKIDFSKLPQVSQADQLVWKVLQTKAKAAKDKGQKPFSYIEVTDDKVMHPAFNLKLNCKGLLPGENELLPNAKAGDMMQQMVQTMKAMTSSEMF